VEPREDDPRRDATSEKAAPSTAPTLPLGTRVFGASFWSCARCSQQRETSPVKLPLLNKEDAEASFTAVDGGFQRRSEFSDLQIWRLECRAGILMSL